MKPDGFFYFSDSFVLHLALSTQSLGRKAGSQCSPLIALFILERRRANVTSMRRLFVGVLVFVKLSSGTEDGP